MLEYGPILHLMAILNKQESRFFLFFLTRDQSEKQDSFGQTRADRDFLTRNQKAEAFKRTDILTMAHRLIARSNS